MLQSLIIGFGRAGKGLHYHCLRKAYQMGSHRALFNPHVGVVDPNFANLGSSQPNLTGFSSLGDVEGFEPDNTVVHICTPPELHTEALREVVKYGYRKIVMEKPLTTTESELDVIREIQHYYGCEILVVANWLSSSLTRKIHTLIQSGVYGPLRYLTAEQNKSRLSRTLANPSHHNAFDVEIPHLVALALFLGGTSAEVVASEVKDMFIGEHVIPKMGMAKITLYQEHGVISRLSSNLATPIRKRRIQLNFDSHVLCGYYPSAQDDSHAWLEICDGNGHLLEEHIMHDDPLSAVFIEYYQYFAGIGEKPVSDLEFNANVVRVICQAKETCGLLTPALSPELGAYNMVNMG
ncbi:putative dehydrogenase [Paenibacillus shirakamiensis]|uniref:Dehydrogenase n=1 Tax=Paenibacillus shirakamiensis TaxID=1265935 RepID=A0ABS4JEX5_9BACL|nr:Gfo/Idh/MocA family oxidoreductase [Paenibacillus shirakamiensis]MBP2000267.1 putative dehydrogenase [Paenibacillus shirakamiensis]